MDPNSKNALIKFILVALCIAVVILLLPYWILYKFFGGWMATTVNLFFNIPR